MTRKYGISVALVVGVTSMVMVGSPGAAAAVDVELEVIVVPTIEPGDDSFGADMAVSDDAVLVGAPRHSSSGVGGSVSIMRPRPDGAVGYDETRIIPSDADSTTHFGRSVDIDGDTFVVGSSQGVHVFTSNGAGGFDETKLDVAGVTGITVAVSNGVIVVGAADAVSVYVPNPSGGYDPTTLDAPKAASVQRFGGAVDIDGDTIVVGASGTGGTRTGTAYVYTADGVGGYTRSRLVASDGSVDDEFGSSVAIDGDTIVVGATEGDSGTDDTGAAYVFRPDGADGYTETKLTASDARPGDRFGRSVAIAGDVIVVGAPAANIVTYASGAAYVFDSDGADGYTETQLIASDASDNDRFGRTVAAFDDTIVVGAARALRGARLRGVVYVYDPDWYPATSDTSLTIVQETPSDDTTDFKFGGTFGSFRLDDPAVDDGDDVTDRVTFTGAAGAVVIRQTGYSRWTRPVVDCGEHRVDARTRSGDTIIAVTLVAGDEVTCSFTNERFSGAISARVFEDMNADGTRNSSDSWLEGWTVHLLDENGNLADSSRTDIDGRVGFSALESGTYRACLDVKNLWSPTKPSVLDPVLRLPCELVVFTNGDRTFLRFGVNQVDVGEEIKLIPQIDTADDNFGARVAMSGESILVGSPGGKRSVSLFRRAADGTYGETRIGSDELGFGYSVDIDADTFVVGTPSGSRPGAAYVFTPDGAGGFSETRLVASDGGAYDRFGHDVAVSGTTVVVSATGTYYQVPAGVFVLTPDGAGGYDETELDAPTRPRDREFGTSVDIFGDTVVVGATNDNPNGIRSGSVYVYVKDSTGDFVQTRLAPSDGAVDDDFGSSVAIEDGVIVVGAFHHDGGSVNSGAVYVYRPDGVGGYVESKLVASDGAEDDRFGQSVALSGATVVAGAPGADTASGLSGNGGGAIYVFEADGSGGYADAKIVSTDVSVNDRFGTAVAVTGDALAVGASGVKRGLNIAGAVYVYRD